MPYSWICRNCNPRRKLETFRILQFNCNGLKNKLNECISYMERIQCKIGLFQETFLKPATKMSHPSYSVLRKDRLRDKGGGIVQEEDGHTEALGISIELTELKIVNVYIPPASSCPANFAPALGKIFDLKDAIIGGNFNAHSRLWNSGLPEDRRGAEIAEHLGTSEMVGLNGEDVQGCPQAGEKAHRISP